MNSFDMVNFNMHKKSVHWSSTPWC